MRRASGAARDLGPRSAIGACAVPALDHFLGTVASGHLPHQGISYRGCGFGKRGVARRDRIRSPCERPGDRNLHIRFDGLAEGRAPNFAFVSRASTGSARAVEGARRTPITASTICNSASAPANHSAARPASAIIAPGFRSCASRRRPGVACISRHAWRADWWRRSCRHAGTSPPPPRPISPGTGPARCR